MGKKNRHRHQKHVLKSFQDLGKSNDLAASPTISRLATTVKADVETFMVGAQKKITTPLNDAKEMAASMADRGEKQMQNALQRVSQIAQKILPDRLKKPAGENLKASQKLKIIARQMATSKQAASRERRSRLPFFVAGAVIIMGLGGYYSYQHLTLPTVDLKVGDYVDQGKTWLDGVAGKIAPMVKKMSQPMSDDNAVVTNSSSSRELATKAMVATPPVPKSVVHVPKRYVPTRADKVFAKLSSQKKKQIWKKRLASLERIKVKSPYQKIALGKTSKKQSVKAVRQKSVKKSVKKSLGKKSSNRHISAHAVKKHRR